MNVVACLEEIHHTLQNNASTEIGRESGVCDDTMDKVCVCKQTMRRTVQAKDRIYGYIHEW